MSNLSLSYGIADEIFARHPGYLRGVVLAFGCANRPSPTELVDLLRAAESSVRDHYQIETLAEQPRIAAWREAYRAFGAKPGKFNPSMENMARRSLRGDPLPSISALVDIGNIVSLRHVIPVGGHAVDVVKSDLALRPALGGEEFIPFGSDQVENPLPGEIILVEGNTVLTRRWTWRQANHTLVLPTTGALEYNVDGLPPVSRTEIEEACEEVRTLVDRFCGGRSRVEILCRENPKMVLTA